MALEILEYPNNVRQRPGMYIGTTENCNVMFKELIDNAVDEYLAGKVNKIAVQVDAISDELNRFTVADNSNVGFSLDETNIDGNPTGRTTMDSALNMLSSSTKFHKESSAIGLNGVGSAVTNALSKEFYAISNLPINKGFHVDLLPSGLKSKYANQKYYIVRYSCGRKKDEYFSDELPEQFQKFADYSTIVSFIPDLDVMDTATYVYPKGIDYVLKVAELTNNKLEIFINDEIYQTRIKDYEYKFDVHLKGQQGGRNPEIHLFGSFGLNQDLFQSNVIGAVNSMACHQGVHANLLGCAYRDAMRELYGMDISGSELMGLNMQVYLMANEIDYDSQSKSRLSRIYDFDLTSYGPLRDQIKKIMKDNDQIFYNQYMKILNFKEVKGELNKKQVINKLLGMDVNDNSTKTARRAQSFKSRKLKDAWSNDRKLCELLVFEGDSASSSAHKTRNPQFQAIFPMRGVPINASKMSIVQALQNEEFRDLFRSIGAGVDGSFNLNKMRYGRIIYFGDEDEDGQRIKAMIVGLFLCHAKFIIEAGRLFIGETPFYIQNGQYIYRDEINKLDHSKPFKRVKGLGGLGKDFGPCVMNIASRRLIQVTIDGANEAIQILREPSKKKELLLETKVVSNELYVGNKE